MDATEVKDYYGYGITTETDSMNGVVKQNGKVIMQFKGETAWMDAERFANDLHFKAMLMEG